MGFFKVQQSLLYLDPMAKTAQAAIAFNDPVTGNDQGQGIIAVGVPHRTKSLWMTDGLCNLLIGSCPAIWDLHQC